MEDKDLKPEEDFTQFFGSGSTKLWYFLILIVFFLSIGFYILRPASNQQVAMAETTLNSFYQPESTEIKPDISPADLDQAATQLNQLPYRSKTHYLSRLEEVEEGLQHIHQANALFEEKEINGQIKKVLASHVNHEVIQQELKGCDIKNLPTEACLNYQAAGEILDNIQIATEAFKDLPQDIKIRGDLEPAVLALSQYETDYLHLSGHPQANLLKDELQHYGLTLGGYIKEGLQFGDYSPEVTEVISQSTFLKEALIGTIFDKAPRIALTFDDGPNPDYTPQLLDILAKHGVKGTFFVMGAYVDEYPEIARRIVKEGHLIANHTYNHFDLATLSDQEVLTQIEWTQESIYDETGVTPTIYRMPFGSGGNRVVELLEREYGMTSILWNLDTMDWSTQDTQTIRENVRTNLDHHTLLLMHDTHPATPESIDLMIPHLKEEGYSFVFPDELDFALRSFDD